MIVIFKSSHIKSSFMTFSVIKELTIFIFCEEFSPKDCLSFCSKLSALKPSVIDLYYIGNYIQNHCCVCNPSAKELLNLSIFFRTTFIASTDSSVFLIVSAISFFSLPFATSIFNRSSTSPFSISVIF